MRTSLILLVFAVGLAGCAKTHYVFELKSGYLVAVDAKKAQPLLAQLDYVRFGTYRCVTCGGAKRAYRREHPGAAFDIARSAPAKVSARATVPASVESRRKVVPLPAAVDADCSSRDAEAAASRCIASVEDHIAKAYWGVDDLSAMSTRAQSLYPDLPAEWVGKLHAAIGLQAHYASDTERAKKEFAAAKAAGFKNPRSIMPKSWTGGALAAFEEAR